MTLVFNFSVHLFGITNSQKYSCISNSFQSIEVVTLIPNIFVLFCFWILLLFYFTFLSIAFLIYWYAIHLQKSSEYTHLIIPVKVPRDTSGLVFLQIYGHFLYRNTKVSSSGNSSLRGFLQVYSHKYIITL